MLPQGADNKGSKKAQKRLARAQAKGAASGAQKRDKREKGEKGGQPATLRSSEEGSSAAANAGNLYAGLSDKDRIRIKRRKVGKFIGLVGMETPVEEIAGRIQASLERTVERGREELRRNEEVMLRRKKMA